nr:MAG TPA: hypothetical protein [Caudoviricetes sp.]
MKDFIDNNKITIDILFFIMFILQFIVILYLTLFGSIFTFYQVMASTVLAFIGFMGISMVELLEF